VTGCTGFHIKRASLKTLNCTCRLYTCAQRADAFRTSNATYAQYVILTTAPSPPYLPHHRSPAPLPTHTAAHHTRRRHSSPLTATSPICRAPHLSAGTLPHHPIAAHRTPASTPFPITRCITDPPRHYRHRRATTALPRYYPHRRATTRTAPSGGILPYHPLHHQSDQPSHTAPQRPHAWPPSQRPAPHPNARIIGCHRSALHRT